MTGKQGAGNPNYLGSGLQLGGGAITAGAQYSAGQYANNFSKIQEAALGQKADQLDFSANAAEAAGINAASASKRKNQFVQSRIIALNAVEGGSSTDKNVAELLANTNAEGEYNALNDIYQGESRAQQLRNEATGAKIQGVIARSQGKQALTAGKIGALTTLIGSGGKAYNSFYGKYDNKIGEY